MNNSLEIILSNFVSFPLSDLENDELMQRVEEKYFFHYSKLEPILAQLVDQAEILEIEKKRSFAYESEYLDTENFDAYLQHHNKRKSRYKLRFRNYLDTGLKFLEIKHKDAKGVMSKQRMSLTENGESSTEELNSYVEEFTPYKLDKLNASLAVSYDRITLRDKSKTERLTIDRNLCFKRPGKSPLEFKNLVIVELKQSKRDPNSVFKGTLRKEGIRRKSISKYCLGVSSLYDEIKSNAFKEQQREVRKIENYA